MLAGFEVSLAAIIATARLTTDGGTTVRTLNHYYRLRFSFIRNALSEIDVTEW